MSYRTFYRSLVILALSIGMGGCSTWLTGNYDDPEVHLVKVSVIKARLTHQDIRLRFSIDNPNDSSLPVRGMDYDVQLAGLKLAEGSASDWFTVAPHSKAFYDIEVRTNLWQHLKPLAKLLRHPDQPIPYTLRGELKTGLLFGHRLYLSKSGEIMAADFHPE